MTDSYIQVFSLGDKFLMEFSAVQRLFADGRFEPFFDELFNSDKKIVINKAFRHNVEIVRKQADTQEKLQAEAIGLILEQFRNAGRLIESDNLSWESFIREYSDDRYACLVVLEHSFAVERIRDMCAPAAFSVCVVTNDEIRPYSRPGAFLSTELSYSVHPVSKTTDYLDAKLHCNVGDKVYDEDGQPILLTEKISTGAEGIVFRTADPKCVAKIYHNGVITPLRWRKLIHMTQKGINASGICWPSRLLYTFNKVPVGFLMQAGAGQTLGSVFDGPDAILGQYPEWVRLDVVRVALRVLEKVMYLHTHGVIIGDIQMKNMMMKDSEHVYLIDMDSVQIEDMPCPVGTEEYTSPELWDYSFSDVLRRPVHEDYSCSILVFSILFCGQHPYAQRFGKETLREEIMDRSFPYSSDSSEESLVPIGGYDKIWDALTPALRSMFTSAFCKGTRFEPIEWYVAILEYKKELTDKKFADEEAYRLFPHTDHTISDNQSDKPKTYKKTLREAIMDASTGGTLPNTRPNMSSSENLMYNSQERREEILRNAEPTFSRGPQADGVVSITHSEKEPVKSVDASKPTEGQTARPKTPGGKPQPKSRFETIKSFVAENRRLLLLTVLLILVFTSLMILIGIMYG